jgi:hypothetical protein
MLGQMSAGILDVPPSSRKLVDKEALDAMRVAVEAAPGVWDVMEEILGDFPEADGGAILIKARAATDRLRESIRALQHGDAHADRKALREDAHAFVKASPGTLTLFFFADFVCVCVNTTPARRRSSSYQT